MFSYPKILSRWMLPLFMGLLLAALMSTAQAQTSSPTPINFSINLGGENGGGDVNVAIQLLFVMTLLTLAPSIIILMTSFTRIVIVLGFVRNALGVQQAPSNQIVIGLSLFLTLFLMGPLWSKVYSEAVVPYMEEQATATQALEVGGEYLKGFMLKQTRSTDIEFFLGLAGEGPTNIDKIPFRVVVPAFIISELRTAFQMGFLIFIPFIVIDFIVASTLMAMGMMMMPPVIISLPFKLLLFVLVDGWYLIVRSLVESFNI